MSKYCNWKSAYGIFEDGNDVFKVECNDNPTKYKSVPNNFSFHDFKFCPFCGRKIKWLKAGGENDNR